MCRKAFIDQGQLLSLAGGDGVHETLVDASRNRICPYSNVNFFSKCNSSYTFHCWTAPTLFFYVSLHTAFYSNAINCEACARCQQGKGRLWQIGKVDGGRFSACAPSHSCRFHCTLNHAQNVLLASTTLTFCRTTGQSPRARYQPVRDLPSSAWVRCS